MLLRVLAVVLASVLAAILSAASRLGSVAAICFLLPYAVLLLSWPFRNGMNRNLRWLLIMLPAVAMSAVAIDPGPLNLSMAWLSLAVLAIAQSAPQLNDFLHIIRNALFGLLNSMRMLRDDTRALNAFRKQQGLSGPDVTPAAMALPLAAVAVFTALLAAANPLIAQAFNVSDLSTLIPGGTLRFSLVFGLTVLALWPVLRAKLLSWQPPLETGAAPSWHHRFFQPASVALTLLCLNGLFAWENALDFRHVWQDGALPRGFTHAQYVHRGSYTLIATVILAAALMIFALWPKTKTAENKSVRWLVYIWISQNLMLVASSARRTLAYVEDYGMSEWRLAGLIWMGLVAFGIASICWHVLKRRSNRWLINCNLAACLALLLVCGFWDGKAIIANWNVARKIAGPSSSIDYAYLASLGQSALPAINKLRPLLAADHAPGIGYSSMVDGELVSPPLNYLDMETARLEQEKTNQQADWRSWTLRSALQ